MGRNLPEFRLGNLGGSGLNPKFVGPSPIKTDDSQNKFAANFNAPLTSSGTK
jgi:hypothetical protein